MTDQHVCEEQGCTSTDTNEYHWFMPDPGEPETTWLCDAYAAETGFCLWCRHFGAGSEEYDFSGHEGYHRECFEELRYEVGDWDEDDDEDDFDWGYPEWEDMVEGEEGGRWVGPGSENAGDDEPPDLHGGHEGFYMNVDGESVHVLGDPNMSEETAKALAEVARAARRYIENKDDDE